MCAQKMKRKVKGKSVRRYSKKLPFVYPSMFQPILDGPTFSGKKKKLELNTGEPSYCYSTKISMVSWLWKGHQVEKTVGAFKTRSHFPTPELSWTPQKKQKIEGHCFLIQTVRMFKANVSLNHLLTMYLILYDPYQFPYLSLSKLTETSSILSHNLSQ